MIRGCKNTGVKKIRIHDIRHSHASLLINQGCDALTKPQAIKDFYENEELIAITKELADTLRRNKTIDWQKRESARAKMRMLIKKLLKKHKYPPEGMEDAVQTVMTQCELWTDNNDMGEEKVVNF